MGESRSVTTVARVARLLFAGFDIAALCVAITDTAGALVYAALLANEEVGLTAAWVNSALHQVTPAVLLADWVFFPPWPRKATYRKALIWLAFPLAYFAYSLIRGAASTGTPTSSVRDDLDDELVRAPRRVLQADVLG
jgi:hypothetical protein